MKRIFLIGYMGSGKTTIGKVLAKKLELQFIDIDLLIENHCRKSVSTIFEEKGEEGFRRIECQILQKVVEFENVVVSTGGGLPCFFDNMDLMNRSGITIYLKASSEELLKRLESGKQNRPLIKDKNTDDLKNFIEQNLKERDVFYNKSTYIFEIKKFMDKKDINSNVELLISNLSL